MADGIVITGPTASGKSAIALALAEQIDGEIISMDSRQVYIGMDIGTAKPTPDERTRIQHFGIDLVRPSERYSAGRFSRDARRWVKDIQSRGKTPILVGGTGFFLRALTNPMFAEPDLDRDRKDILEQQLGKLSREELLRWLNALDPRLAERMVSEGGRHRIARAIEVALLTGRPLSHWHEQPSADSPLHFATFVAEMPREELYQRINRRVENMIAAGLVQEVENLLRAGYDEHSPGMNAVGYIELIPHVRGEKSLEQAVDEIQRSTRRYARRQLTWFRHQLPSDKVMIDSSQPVAHAICEISSSLRNL